MKKILTMVYTLGLMLIIGCNVATSNNQEGIFNFTGTWEVTYIQNLSESGIDKNINRLIGSKIKIGNNEVNVLGDEKNNIQYKLKAVNEEYILSSECNITMKEFMNGCESVDIISIIDGNQMVGEFFLNSDSEMIFIYKSVLFKMNRISKEVKFDGNNSTNNFNTIVESENEYSTEGVMIGIKTPSQLLNDKIYSDETYKTLWISHENGKIGSVYKKNDIIFPRIKGLWKLSLNEKYFDNIHFNEFQTSQYDGVSEPSAELRITSNEYKTIKFVGNDYISIQKYVGNNFNGDYPINQIIPVNNINIENGLQIDEVSSVGTKENYKNEFSREISNLTEESMKGLDVSNIDYSNIFIGRSEGKWIIKSSIPSINENESGMEFSLPFPIDKRILNYNSLYIPWKTLKNQLGFIKDAFISPLGKLALIQFDDYIGIYNIENGEIVDEQPIMIAIGENDEIIMSEWCSGSYVERWEKAFIDGELILESQY